VPYVVASASSGEHLDGVQLSAARRVTMESARTAPPTEQLARLERLSGTLRGPARDVCQGYARK
jgi:hypothetical protein